MAKYEENQQPPANFDYRVDDGDRLHSLSFSYARLAKR